ncbi:MAG: 16S rRNA (cytidine(1402)-2'-O)-methyltransferase [Candidatus Competibacteraceae bacterium]
MNKINIEPGVLYVVATPIGNLGDISARALQVLREVAWIAAEDTRHSKRLLHHFGIHTPLVSLHDHNEQARIPQLLADLQAGKAIALIADAGTPLISDPGFPLLRQIRVQGLKATPIPGPSSLTAALSVAGLPTDRFAFEGFLPAKPQARRNYLSTLLREPRTLVFFESSHRIQATLTDMRAVFGTKRQAVLARELTKQFEQVHHGTLDILCDWLDGDTHRCRGEFVIVMEGATIDRRMGAGRNASIAFGATQGVAG